MREEILKECEEIHYQLLTGMFYDEEIKIGDSKVMLNHSVEDSSWNHATRTDTENPEKSIEAITEFMFDKNRTPAICLTPICKPGSLEKALILSGFDITAEETWMTYQGNQIQKVTADILTVKNLNQLSSFKKIYGKVFGSPEEPIPQDSDGIVNAWINYYFKKNKDSILENYLYFEKNQPVGIGTLLGKNGFFGIYNVGTLPEFEGQGIGTKILQHMINQALKNKAKNIFLQTLDKEKFYAKRGFKTEFVGKCYELLR